MQELKKVNANGLLVKLIIRTTRLCTESLKKPKGRVIRLQIAVVARKAVAMADVPAPRVENLAVLNANVV
jgi:hypothetical protein